MTYTKHPDLNSLLDEFKTAVLAILKDDLLGIYLVGSFSMGGGDTSSDVDWLAVTREMLTDDQVTALNKMHTDFRGRDLYWAQHLEGSYMPLGVLQDTTLRSVKIPYVDNGAWEIAWDTHDNTLVERWAVRERGITLYGVDPKEIIPEVPAESLKRESFQIFRDWGEEILRGDYKIDAKWAQQFVVLSYTRVQETLATGEVRSKPSALAWARENLEPQWVALIERAWVEREDAFTKVFDKADPEEVALTKEYMRFVMDKHNPEYGG